MTNILLSMVLSALAFSGVVLGAQTDSRAAAEDPGLAAPDTYNEECLNEGCATTEVAEMHNVYWEECANEGCYFEEKAELAGGGPGAVRAMEEHFRSLGWGVRAAVDE